MKRIIATLAALAAAPAAAQEAVLLGYGDPPDRAWLTPIAPHHAHLGYHNSGGHASVHGMRETLSVDGMTIDVEVETSAGPEGADALHLFPRDGYIAVPPVIVVADGDTGYAVIMLPMY